VRTLLSIVFSAVPERYRGRFLSRHELGVQRGALLSGIAQILLCLGIFIARFLWLMQKRPGDIADVAIRHNAEEVLISQHAQFGMGFLTLLEYMIQPLTLVLIYFIFEGLVRGLAALLTQEVVPSLPLQAIAFVHDKIDAKRRERELGPLVIDEVRPGDGDGVDLVIASCRARSWTSMLMIEYQEHLYELIGSELDAPPRRYLYRLRKSPPQKAFRGMHHYSPDELLPKDEPPSSKK